MVRSLQSLSILTVGLFAITSIAVAKHKHPERWYQDKWCEGKGETEVRLEDRTRVDCLTDTHAVEHDFAPKWAESLGQALNYARITGKRAGIVIILEHQKNRYHVERLEDIIEFYELPVDVWVMENFEKPEP